MPQTTSGFRINILSFLFCLMWLPPMFLSSCSSSSGKSFFPELPGYDAKQKKVMVLPKRLLEISGHVVLSEGNFVGINDEDGELIYFSKDSKKDDLQSRRFAGKGDYEDMVRIGTDFYIMESNGDIHVVKDGSTEKTQYKFSRDLKIEFESLAHYSDINKLILISKDHRLDEEAIFAFSFDLASKTFDSVPFFTMQMKDIFVKLKDYSSECKPSSAAIHPIEKKLFIIASVGKVLVVATPDGKVESVYRLNPSQFQQPEGISFASNGDMYISNEGLQGKSTMMLFPYKKLPVK